MSLRGIAASLMMLLLAGSGSGAVAGPAPHAGPFAEGIELAVSAEGLGQDASASPFNFLHIRDLWVRVNVSKLPKTAALHLVFVSPRGETFYETNLYFSKDTRVKSVAPQGGDQPAAVLQASRVPGGFALDQPIPIAGSVFLRYPMPGTWMVQARISGVAETFSTTLEVEVTP